MVAPFTPYSKFISVNRVWMTPDGRALVSKGFVLSSTGVRQKPPYVPTAYTADVMRAFSGAADAGSWATSPGGDSLVEATNKARARFVSKIGDTSQLGSTLTAELKSTYGTVVGGIVTVLQSAHAVKKGRLVEAARLLGISPPTTRQVVKLRRRKGGGKTYKVTKNMLTLPTGREVVQSVGSKWLWWSYGVKPLAGDMYNALDVLQRPLPEMEISGSGSGTNTVKYGPETYVFKSKIRISANVRVNNPNLFLANQLGLTNPVQWINEGIAFSFVVDWFSNLSQVISQMTDFVGLEIVGPMTAEKSSVHHTYVWWGATDVKEWTRYRRTLSIPEAKLRFAYERFQWQRGANAVSLLVQFLKKQ